MLDSVAPSQSLPKEDNEPEKRTVEEAALAQDSGRVISLSWQPKQERLEGVDLHVPEGVGVHVVTQGVGYSEFPRGHEAQVHVVDAELVLHVQKVVGGVDGHGKKNCCRDIDEFIRLI